MEDIKIFDSDDEKLKNLGELLSNESSRKIIKFLIQKESYTNEIANKLDLRVSLVIHHLKKMEKLGLLEINNKKIIRKGIEHKFFKMNPGIFLLLNFEKEEIQEQKKLKKIFKNTVKLSISAIACVLSWVILSPEKSIGYPTLGNETISPEIGILCIVIIILSLELLFTKKKYLKKPFNYN